MHRATLLGSVLWAVWSGPLGAQAAPAWQDLPEPDTTALTVAEARRLALHRNPDLLADLQRVGAARGDLRDAGTYPFNPDLEVEGPGSITDGGPGRYEVRVGQEIEWAGQRGLRVDAAGAGLTATRSAVRDEARLVLAEVERTWFALAAAERRRTVAGEIRELNDRLLGAVRTQLAEGEVSLLQANLVEIEAARARARVLAAERDVTRAETALTRLVGLGASTAIRTEGAEAVDWTRPGEPEALSGNPTALALARRPDVAAARASAVRAASLRSLASREAVPNLRISALAEGDGGAAGSRFGVGFSLPIPVFDRNQGLRMRRAAEVDEALLRLDAVEVRVRTEVADALRGWRFASRQVEIFEADILVPVRENQRMLETAYREGKLDLSSLLLLRNQLLDAELGYWEAWEREREAEVALRSATATILDDLGPDLPEELR